MNGVWTLWFGQRENFSQTLLLPYSIIPNMFIAYVQLRKFKGSVGTRAEERFLLYGRAHRSPEMRDENKILFE